MGMELKLRCANKEAREAVSKACDNTAKARPLSELEGLLCDIVPMADNCPFDGDVVKPSKPSENPNR